MKFKIIRFNFKHELTESEENIFIRSFQDVRLTFSKKLDDKLNSLKLASRGFAIVNIFDKTGTNAADATINILNNMKENMHRYFLLDHKPSNKYYDFMVAYENIIIKKDFKSLEFINADKNWEKVKKETTKHFERVILPRMRLNKSNVEVTYPPDLIVEEET